MSNLPKLKIRLTSGDQSEFICDLEQARRCLNFNEGVFAIEGQGIQSYDELVRIATGDKYKDEEFLEIKLLQAIDGG